MKTKLRRWILNTLFYLKLRWYYAQNESAHSLTKLIEVSLWMGNILGVFLYHGALFGFVLGFALTLSIVRDSRARKEKKINYAERAIRDYLRTGRMRK